MIHSNGMHGGTVHINLFGGSSDPENPLPFKEARAFCNDQKGDLAQLKTQEIKVGNFLIHSNLYTKFPNHVLGLRFWYKFGYQL